MNTFGEVIGNENEAPIQIIPVQVIQWGPALHINGSTFRALYTGTVGVTQRREIALKILRENLDLQKVFNVNYWSQFNNANIVKLFWHGRFTETTLQVNNELMLITEYCNGGSLDDLIRQHFPNGLNARYYKLLLQCIFNSWSYLSNHNPPLLNRHIMPSKILLHRRADGDEIFKLNGFAYMCARPNYENQWTNSDYVAGNLKYLKYWHPQALEKYIFRDSTVTHSDKTWTDLYSTGTVLYEAATGRHNICTGEFFHNFTFMEQCWKLWGAYNLKKMDRDVLSLCQLTDNVPWVTEYGFPEGIQLAERPDLLLQLRILIVNLLQVDKMHIMSFHHFLDECEDILVTHFAN